MKHTILFLLAIFSSLVASAQGQAVEFFDDNGNILNRGFISPRTILEFSNEKDYIDLIDYNTTPPSTLLRVMIEDIDHISFIEDWSEVSPLLADTPPQWKSRIEEGGEFIALEPAGQSTPTLPASLRIYDLSGRMVAGRNGWNGERIRIGMLPAGKYILIIDNLNLTFFKK